MYILVAICNKFVSDLTYSLREKCPNTELFLVRIFLYFSYFPVRNFLMYVQFASCVYREDSRIKTRFELRTYKHGGSIWHSGQGKYSPCQVVILFLNSFKVKLGFVSLESRCCICHALSETFPIPYQVVSFIFIQFL